MPEASAPTPWLLRWQGLLGGSSAQQHRLSTLAGLVLILLLGFLPVLTRAGLGLIVLACGALWVLWSLTRAPGRIGPISGWVLLFLAVAVLATGVSPVPVAAAKGLVKLISYLGVYALMRQLLAEAPQWWDRLVAALLGGSLLSSVLALRQLYGPTEELARWADPNSVAEGTIRIYGPLGNPNLLAGYLVPILPIAMVAMLRWRGWGSKLYAAAALVLGTASTLFSYSRGGWLGMLAALGVLMLLLVLRQIRHWPLLWRRLLPLALLLLGGVAIAFAATQVEPIRTRVASLLAGRGDSSNNFRINVWLAAIDMIQDRPWLGIGPGNAAFNSIYPLYQQPKFNALSAYSLPLEILVETGIPGLLACVGLAIASLRRGVRALSTDSDLALPCLGCLAAIAGLMMQGAADTIFFRPEVQISGWFCLATLSLMTRTP
ncbi:MAG: IctB family putative bicarbonate transporter [Cyanobacteriota bacterium]|nr:IctB family putative bicarbonate transporter [Cyanobacteriota bacterium]